MTCNKAEEVTFVAMSLFNPSSWNRILNLQIGRKKGKKAKPVLTSQGSPILSCPLAQESSSRQATTAASLSNQAAIGGSMGEGDTGGWAILQVQVCLCMY